MRFGIRELIFLIVLLAVPVTSFLYVFKPRNEQIQRAKNEIEIKRAKLDKLNDVTSKIPDIGVAIEDGREAIELIEAKLPSQEEVDVILESVWQLAEKNHLKVIKTEAKEPVPAPMYQEQPLKTKIEGRFEGFYQFLLDLEELPRITRIHQLDIEKKTRMSNDEMSSEGNMEAEFTLSIFYQSSSDSNASF